MIKMEKVMKENKRLQKDNAQLQDNLNILKELNHKLEEEVEKYLTKLDHTLLSLDQISKDLAAATEEKDKINNEKTYYMHVSFTQGNAWEIKG